MKKLLLITAGILLLASPAFAKGANRKIASVNPGESEKVLKKAAIDMSKAFAGFEYHKTATWGADVKKDAGKATITVVYNYFDKKEELGISCPFTVTIEPSKTNPDMNMATVEMGFCAD
jgi:hypothetical protein